MEREEEKGISEKVLQELIFKLSNLFNSSKNSRTENSKKKIHEFFFSAEFFSKSYWNTVLSLQFQPVSVSFLISSRIFCSNFSSHFQYGNEAFLGRFLLECNWKNGFFRLLSLAKFSVFFDWKLEKIGWHSAEICCTFDCENEAKKKKKKKRRTVGKVGWSVDKVIRRRRSDSDGAAQSHFWWLVTDEKNQENAGFAEKKWRNAGNWRILKLFFFEWEIGYKWDEVVSGWKPWNGLKWPTQSWTKRRSFTSSLNSIRPKFWRFRTFQSFIRSMRFIIPGLKKPREAWTACQKQSESSKTEEAHLKMSPIMWLEFFIFLAERLGIQKSLRMADSGFWALLYCLYRTSLLDYWKSRKATTRGQCANLQ